MSPEILITIGLAAVVLTVLAIAMGIILGWANKAFHVEVDPKIDAINDALPAANCGACGFVGCNDYAEAVVQKGADITLCAPGGEACAKKIGAIMGVEAAAGAPLRAVVHCSAKEEDRLMRSDYRGEPTCASAHMVNGVQGCTYGCLGIGDCVQICDYDAIHVVDGLAVVDYDKCVGCKACVAACPRNIISMVPFKADHMFVVTCCSQDTAKDVKSFCNVGCVGCSACTRKLPSEQPISMGGNVAVIDYDAYDPETIDIAAMESKCKQDCMHCIGKNIPDFSKKEEVSS